MIDEKQKESLKELSKQKTPLYPFDTIATKIDLLRMDVAVLNNHPEEFPEKLINEIERLNTNIGDHLLFYIVQEIQDFYRQAYKRFKDAISFPESASIVETLRHINIAHMNAKEPSEIANLCIELEERYGIEKVYSDWVEFKEKLYSAIKEGQLQLK